jgi:hypothetical protein
MKRTLLILSLCIALYSNVSAQDILWEKSYGGKHADFLLDAQPTADYGFILAGSSLSKKSGNKTEDNEGDLDYWIWKMDESGELDWQKSIGGSGADKLYSIRNTRDGGFILAGTSDSQKGSFKKDSCRGKDDIWIVKLDAKGKDVWQKTIGGSGQEMVKSIDQTPDGGYIIGGSSASGISLLVLQGIADPYGKSLGSNGAMDYWIVKLDEKGEVKWQKTFGGKYIDILESIEQTKDGGYIVGGYSNSPSSQTKMNENYGEGDYWILKLDKDGEIEWQQTLGGDGDDHLYAVKQTADGGYVIGGNSSSGATGKKSKSNKNHTDIWLIKLDEKGEIVWQETYNTGNVDVLTSLVENKDGSMLLGGYAQSEVMGLTKADSQQINDYVAIKIDVKGEEIWKEAVGSAGDDILRKLVETRDGGYLLAGTSNGKISRDRNSGKGGNDFWIVKLKDKTKEDSGEQRSMIEAIPNPTQQFTNVIVGFEFSTGTAYVFDMGGRLLQEVPAESRTIPIDLGNYPTGMYVIQIVTDMGTDSVKVLKGTDKL